jgi:sugar O-acyltransferase (sialic acid O-acetyltransferase NeuD family)
MAKKEILLLGAGGHCKSVIEAIESQNEFHIAGILDMPEKVGQTVLGYPVIGSDENIAEWIAKIPNAVVTVGQLKSAAVRIRLYTRLKEVGANLPVIVASSAYVSRHASISEGTVVLHQAFVNAGASIGVNAIINSAAIVEHDAMIGDHTHVSTGARINGDCIIGNEVLIGSNAVLRNGINIESKVVVGAGAVVVKNVSKGLTVVGNPAKEIFHE